MTNNIHSHDSNEQSLHELELLLSEKRTYLSLLRSGLAVFSIPLTVIAVLAATVDYHKIFNSVALGSIAIGGLAIVGIIGLSMFFRAESKIKQINAKIHEVEHGDGHIDDIVI